MKKKTAIVQRFGDAKVISRLPTRMIIRTNSISHLKFKGGVGWGGCIKWNMSELEMGISCLSVQHH